MINISDDSEHEDADGFDIPIGAHSKKQHKYSLSPIQVNSFMDVAHTSAENSPVRPKSAIVSVSSLFDTIDVYKYLVHCF